MSDIRDNFENSIMNEGKKKLAPTLKVLNAKEDKPKDELKNSKKLLSIDEQIQQAIEKNNAKMDAVQKQREANLLQIGARVAKKDLFPGKPIIDKVSNQQVVDQEGNPKCYADKYSVTLQFLGGEITTDIDFNIYERLVPGTTYFCVGYMGEVNDFGKKTLKPIFTEYHEI